MNYKLGNTIIEATNINHFIGDKHILRDININIRNIKRTGVNQGQIIALLGPSGCGKTQLFKILTGLLTPKTGNIVIDNTPVQPGDVGIIAQDYPLFHNRTVTDNLSIAVKHAPDTSNADIKIKNMLARFNMVDKADHYPNELSGGQRQRVAIMQQVLCGHNFMMMDEPFSGLDIVMKDEVKEAITEISMMDEKNTIIIVSHNIADAASVADQIWIMGHERDDTGKQIPGAVIRHKFDLKVMGLAWQEHLDANPAFISFVQQVEAIFREL